MNCIVPLRAHRHSGLRFDRDAAAANRQFVRLGLSEIAFAAADMPLCFAKDSQTGRFNLIALLGLIQPTNLFSIGGRFHATYVPRAAMLTGFRLDGDGDAGLAIDEGDPTIGNRGELLFVDGRPSAILNDLRGGLEQAINDAAASQKLVDSYATKRLIRPLKLMMRMSDGRQHDIAGLYTVDEAALRRMPDVDVLALHHADALAPLSILSSSLAQVERLFQLHNSRLAPSISSYDIG
jgi:hypothetical protein